MPMFVPPPTLKQAAAIAGGNTAIFAQNANTDAWVGVLAWNVSAQDVPGEIYLTDPAFGLSNIRVKAGYNWVSIAVRASFGDPADGNDNGVGYRAVMVGDEVLARAQAVTSAVGGFVSYAGTNVTGTVFRYLGGVAADIPVGFQHTAGVGADRRVYFQFYVRAWK